ncbi:MAG: DUF6443 domain-containing protein [Paludibacter sp.]|nr:DUF6443 domain-containing protein [Paludibacter sp.]
MKLIPERILYRIFTCILIALYITSSYAEGGGVIVLNQPTPATAVIVTATEQVVLKPGFQASASAGTFEAKIGTSNSIAPLFSIAEESTFEIPVASNDQNYIKTSTALLADANSPMMITIQYLDGLGRPSQTVQMGITPEGADLVSLTKYDSLGREWKSWLPTPTAGNFGQYVEEGSFTSNASTQYNDNNPYAEVKYEPSPLNRITDQYGAGASWHNNSKRVTTSYETNDGNVVYYYVNESGSLQRGLNYTAATLYKTTVADEDGKATCEYKDKLGQVVLKQSFDGADKVNTYYVYNDLGQLSYVIPPIAADSLPASIGQINDDNGVLKRYAYLYKYDERGNCIEKRLPGCDPIYMVYDKADRLILSQDGNQRLKQQWTVNKYDVLGRLLYTGYQTSTSSTRQQYITKFRDLIVTESYAGSNGFAGTGYSCNTNYFTETISPLTVNYYDNHNFVTDLGLSTLAYVQNTNYDSKYDNHKGLLTGRRTYLLDGSGNNTTSAMYYDYKGQVVQSRATNHLGGYDIAYNKYNFTGNLTKTLKEHSISGQNPVTELYDYAYDHALRPTNTTYTLNNKPPVVLASNKYDKFGRLAEKKRHGSADTEEFEYNLRGWTTKIKSGSFEQNLYYNGNINNPFATNCYNGNIAFSTWTYNGSTKAYVYDYDNLNRLTEATAYQTNGYTLYAPNNKEKFDYDKQGNIERLWRDQDYTGVDFLQMTYNGNQIKSITDAYTSQGQYSVKEYQDKAGNSQDEMSYDTNGNMIKDLDRDIVTIKYNLLNLPELVQFKNGCQIRNTYSAGGQKLSSRYVTVAEGVYQPLNPGQVIENLDVNENDNVTVGGTDYVGNIEYEIYRYFNWDVTFEPAELKYLWRVHNPEGYVSTFGINSSYGPVYNYYRKDHLGNNREVWNASYKWGSATRPAATNQITQYYPSGLPWASNTSDNPGSQPYKYNGKEFVEMHGWDSYDYGARVMYPAIGPQFMSVDPLCEKYYWISPYAYCLNNPVRFVDPDGRDIWEINSRGEIVSRIEDKSQDKFVNVSFDSDGKKVEGSSKSFEFGTVTAVRTPTVKVKDSKTGDVADKTLTIFEMKGDENATQLFEFFANPTITSVEWTHAKIGTEKSGRNVVGTSHDESSTPIGHYLRSTGYTLKEVTHNHPGSSPPSGTDINNAALYIQKNANILLKVYTYPGNYIYYNEFGISLPPIGVSPNKK